MLKAMRSGLSAVARGLLRVEAALARGLAAVERGLRAGMAGILRAFLAVLRVPVWVLRQVMAATRWVGALIWRVVVGIGAAIGAVLSAIGRAVRAVFGAMWRAIRAVLRVPAWVVLQVWMGVLGVGTLIGYAVLGILYAIRTVLGAIGRAVRAVFVVIGRAVSAVFRAIWFAIRAVLRAIGWVVLQAWVGVLGVGTLIGHVVLGVLYAIRAVFGAIGRAVRAVFRAIWIAIRAVLRVPGWVLRQVWAGVRWVGALIGRVVAGIVAAIRAVFSAIGRAIHAVFSAIVRVVRAVLAVPVWIARTILAVLRWIGRLIYRFVAWVAAGVRAVVAAFMRVVRAVLAIPGRVLRALRAGLLWVIRLPGRGFSYALQRLRAARDRIGMLPAQAAAGASAAAATTRDWSARLKVAGQPWLARGRSQYARLEVERRYEAVRDTAVSLVAPKGALEPDLARRMVFGLALIGALGASFGVWAATTPIAGAVIASGLVVVESNIKKVQHPSGGIVGEILVKNGDRVAAGDIVLKLDETQARANLGIIVSQIVQMTGRKARLEAERDQADKVVFPPDFLAGSDDAAAIAEGEARLFEVRQLAKKGQIAQYRERIGQLHQEIKGVTAQLEAKQVEVALMAEELERVDQMRKKDLLPTTRLLTAQRDHTRLKGEWGALLSQAARAQGQISEIELQIIGLDQTMQTEASKELREIEARMAELAERRIGAEDQLKRVILRAPLDGVVHELSVHTVGGVIAGGEAVMSIVPNTEALTIEVRIATADIDQVTVGQEAVLRFPAFNQRTTPELRGLVSRLAADLTREAQTNAVFYVGRVRLVDEDKDKLKLVPGMPVEVFIATGDRTALSYLVKPISDQLSRAFRER